MRIVTIGMSLLRLGVLGGTTIGCGGGVCATGNTSCDTVCVNLQFDAENCGACGVVCASGEVCSQGSCSDSCGAGTTECSGGCVDTQIDPTNCGGCEVVCASGEVCSQGSCGSTCGGATTDCGGFCTDTQIDPTNCGACGTACAIDDLAIGVGLQSCGDGNGCGPGGSTNTAGWSRYFDGVETSGDVGPWFVFGR